MSKAIRSPVARLGAFLVGFIAALSAVRACSSSYDYYIRRALGNWLKMGLPVSILLFAVCAALLIYPIWAPKGKGNGIGNGKRNGIGDGKGKITPVWRKIDFALWLVLAYCALVLCVCFAKYGHSLHDHSLLLLAVSAAAYAVAMATMLEAISRLRDKQWGLLWPKFFKLYPIWRPKGLAMALPLAAALLYLFAVSPWEAFGGRPRLTMPGDGGAMLAPARQSLDVPLFLATAIAASWLTYLCAFVLSLSAEYEKATAEKIRAERFKSELITNVSHDIRTPLTSIINYVGLLKALPIKHDAFSEYVDVLDKKSTRLKILINDLMEASKAATGNMAVNLREIDLAEIIGQVAGEFDEQFNGRDLAFVLRQPGGQALAYADSNHLSRVLENIFGNAAKYALPGTRVFAEIQMRGGKDGADGKAALSIKNTSQSPIELSADALTEQFIRGDRARQPDGSGLGLYIAKSLVELMGGQFAIRASGDLFEVEIVFA